MSFAPLARFLAIFCLTLAAFGEDPRRVLFIGNSYTGVNKLPEVFLEVVKSTGGPAPVVKSSTPGGRTLKQHLGIAGSLALIDEGGWDVVVLQGQSQEPAIAEKDESVRKDFLESAAALCSRVRAKSPQARIFFYETWARHADYWKAAKKGPDVGADPKEMQARLRKWYGIAAKENSADRRALRRRMGTQLRRPAASASAYQGSFPPGIRRHLPQRPDLLREDL